MGELLKTKLIWIFALILLAIPITYAACSPDQCKAASNCVFYDSLINSSKWKNISGNPVVTYTHKYMDWNTAVGGVKWANFSKNHVATKGDKGILTIEMSMNDGLGTQRGLDVFGLQNFTVASPNDRSCLYFSDDGGGNNAFYNYAPPGGWVSQLGVKSNDVWYRIKWVINLTTQKYDFYINDLINISDINCQYNKNKQASALRIQVNEAAAFSLANISVYNGTSCGGGGTPAIGTISKIYPLNNSAYTKLNLTISAIINATYPTTNVSFFINQVKNKTITMTALNQNVSYTHKFINNKWYNLSVQIKKNSTTINSSVNKFFVFNNMTIFQFVSQTPANNTQWNTTFSNIFTLTGFINTTSLTIKNKCELNLKDNSLIMHLPFEFGDTSTTAYGYDWNRKYNGSVAGSTYNKTGGYDGFGAYTFKGKTDRINVSYTTGRKLKNYTLSEWVKPAYGSFANTSYTLAIISTVQQNPQIGFKMVTDTTFTTTVACDAYIINKTNSEIEMSTASTSIPKNKYSFITCSYKTSNRNPDNTINYSTILYVNGVQTQTISKKTNNSYSQPANMLQIGAGKVTTTLKRGFNGTIDDVRIYNRTLSATEVLSLFQNSTINITKGKNTQIFTVYHPLSLSSLYNYNFMCFNNISNLISPKYMFYYDVGLPTIQNTFVNNSVYYKGNITAKFNFTDNLAVFSFNVSIDGKSIGNKTGLATVKYQLNISKPLAGYAIGKHTLTERVADGHTAEAIEDYKISTGVFGDVLRFEDDKNYAEIKNKASSLFDKFTVQKKTDRYIWTFKPNTLTTSYTFTVKSNNRIYIIDMPKTIYKKWLITNEKWIDFNLANENTGIDIKQIKDNEVEVTISNIKSPAIQIYHSIGDLNIVTETEYFYIINATQTYQKKIFEGSLNTHTLLLNKTFNTSSSAYLKWNGATKIATKTATNYYTDRYSSAFVVPPSPSRINFTWFFNITGSPIFNMTGQQNYTAMSIANCTNSSSHKVLNFSLYDEATKAKAANNISIETTIILTSIYMANMSWNFTHVVNYSNSVNASTLLICLPDGILNSSNYTLSSITKYQFLNHVPEYHYINNFLLSMYNIPKLIPLYDLLTADSTSFLVEYRDENYLAHAGYIIDILRYYVGEGLFRSVENGKTDEAGQTNAHLVTEDIIYKFNVWNNGNIEYQSSEYKALCQAVPCQIMLQKQGNITATTIGNFIISLPPFNKVTRTSTMSFATRDGTSAYINLSTYKNNGYDNETVCSDAVTGSTGSLSCTIPATAKGNQSYVLKVKEGQNSTTLAYRLLYIGTSAYTRFGYNGIVLAALTFMSLALLGISSGIMMVVFALLGLIFVSLLNILDTGSIIGIGSTLIWIFIAGAIIIYKLMKRRVQ